MTTTTQRYPHATPEGVPIPLDVIKPYGTIRKAFTTAVSSVVTIAANVDVASFLTTEDCFVCFGGTAALGADGVTQANAIFIPKGGRITCAVISTTFTVIGVTASGNLYVQLIDKWAGLALQTKFTGGK